MIGYTKLFSSIVDSSVWGLSKDAKILWITMLAKKDRDHIVRATIPGLSRAACLSIVEVEAALSELSAPDPYSTTPDEEGRRILKKPEGWFVVNGEKYRNMLTKEDRREYNKIKQRESRERRAADQLTSDNHAKGEATYTREINAGSSDDQAMRAANQVTGDDVRHARYQDEGGIQ